MTRTKSQVKKPGKTKRSRVTMCKTPKRVSRKLVNALNTIDPHKLFDEGLHQDDGKKVFESGATSSGHLQERYDLMSPEANRRRAVTYGEGASIHGERNWENGMPISECLNRIGRHLNLYLAGDRSEDHLAHIAVRADFCMHYEKHNPDCQDVATRKGGT